MILLAAAALLVFWVPAVIVLIRREAAYFTNGILWSALIATAAVLLIGAGLTLWARRDRLILTVDVDGVHMPQRSRQPALEARWEELALVRLVGDRDPALAFYLHPQEAPDEHGSAADEVDLSEPELLRPLDFHNDPPPPMRAPDRQAFDAIRPPAEQEPPDAVPPAPKLSPAERLHATPYVVPLTRTDPPVPQILRAITRLSAGRVRLD